MKPTPVRIVRLDDVYVSIPAVEIVQHSAFSFQFCCSLLRVATTAIVVRIRNITYTYAEFVSQFTCPIVRPINSSKLNKTFAVFGVPGTGADLHGRHL